MNPELRPCRGARNGGRPDSEGFTSCSTRRSEMAARCEAATARTSSASATGWPWKLPPETISPVSGNTSGLSVAAFTSRASVAAAEPDPVARRAVHLGHAAQRVGVLHLVAAGALVRGVQLRAREQLAQPRRRGDLAGLAAHRLDLRRERAVRAEQPLERHRAGEVGERREPLGAEHGERPHRRHRLRSVHQREPFLRLQHRRRQPDPAQRLAGGDALGGGVGRGHERLSLADEEQREVGERSEIARRSDGAALGHDRHDAAIEQREQEIQRLLADARDSLREHVRAEQHQGARLDERERRAHARRVREDEVSLQPLEVGAIDAHLRERPEPGVDPVVRLAVLEPSFDERPRPPHPLARAGRELRPRSPERHRLDLLQREGVAVEEDVLPDPAAARAVAHARLPYTGEGSCPGDVRRTPPACPSTSLGRWSGPATLI